MFFANCKLTEKSVIGKWVSHSDTLSVNQDHSFVFVSKIGSYDTASLKYDTVSDKMGNKTIYVTSKYKNPDISFNYYTGRWKVSRKRLNLNFDQDKKIAFGNCNGLSNRTIFFSKYKLIRPMYCNVPSNRFVIFEKIRKKSLH
ncbi:MAG: hypothetical protein BGP13_25300 [Sphingobacteriales bacterium 40-81]|nr:MAG: hypothetical protein BGP13_25300 [Sphingobacteriales bacterium 40-81]